MGKVADLFFAAHLEDKALQLQAMKAGDKAGLTLGQRISGGLKKLGPNVFAGLGLGLGVSAFGAVDRAISSTIHFLGEAVTAAKEEEVSVAKLGAALTANVAGWDGNTDAIERTLKARMALGFADDEQRQSLATLLAVTKDYTKALDLQRIAMDLARLRNIDLQAAGDIVSKVYGGNIGILSRYGIQIKKGATATEALAEVQKLAAGQAEAYAKTTSGKLLVAQVKVGEAMETLGAEIMPILADAMTMVADAAGPIVEGLGAIIEKGDELGRILTELSGVDPFASVNEEEPNAIGQAVNFLTDEFTHLLDSEYHAAAGAKAIARAMSDGSTTIAEGARGIGVASASIEGSLGGIGDAAGEASRTVRRSAREILETVQGLRDAAAGKATAAAAALYDPLILAAEAAATQQERLEQKRIIASKKATKEEIQDAKNRLLELNKLQIEQIGQMLTFGTEAEQISKTSAFLVSDFWIQAYDDATPEQAAILDDWRATLESRLASMIADARKGGSELTRNYRDEIAKGKPGVATATDTLTSGSDVPFSVAANDARHSGEAAGTAYAAGLKSKRKLVEIAAAYLGAGVGDYIKISSPAKKGPLSEGGGPEGWGEQAVLTLAEGMRRQIAAVRGAASDVAGALAGSIGSPLGSRLAVPSGIPAFASSGISAAPGGVTRINNINVEVEGLLPAKNPFEVGLRLQRLADAGAFDGPEDR